MIRSTQLPVEWALFYARSTWTARRVGIVHDCTGWSGEGRPYLDHASLPFTPPLFLLSSCFAFGHKAPFFQTIFFLHHKLSSQALWATCAISLHRARASTHALFFHSVFVSNTFFFLSVDPEKIHDTKAVEYGLDRSRYERKRTIIITRFF